MFTIVASTKPQLGISTNRMKEIKEAGMTHPRLSILDRPELQWKFCGDT